ncbi:MAG: M48 family metallopeptidase [Sedimentisphaerales bacterium]|jgi:predicted Zn-dependent protease|nr:M48 family metallopeptidase [Sedimentisphaerales bacterium]
MDCWPDTRPKALAASVAILTLLLGCAEVPITGRQQLNLVPDALILGLSLQEYNQFLSTHKVIASGPDAEMVRQVGQRIRDAVDRFGRKHLAADPFAGCQWEFVLVEDKALNAFAMPGGKVVVNTGILPLTVDANGLAVVIGHEIAHLFARHGSERLTQGLLLEMGGMALSKALEQRPQQTRQLFMTCYGLGSQIGLLLPYSRLHEQEADRLGLIFMAMAGYDPHAAIAFWQRMAEQGKGRPSPPEFLSTHPADQTRIEAIRRLLPEAMEYYQAPR